MSEPNPSPLWVDSGKTKTAIIAGSVILGVMVTGGWMLSQLGKTNGEDLGI